MTQEDKNLLLKDLFARLLYNPFVRVGNNPNPFKINHRLMWTLQYGNNKTIEDLFKNIKPYLRPMSSMTEEEKMIQRSKMHYVGYFVNHVYYHTLEEFDYLNSIHVDYRTDNEGKTMIERGLALEAPEGMYNIKEK